MINAAALHARKCGVFEGFTCSDWLSFQPQWKALMRHYGVENIILEGIYYGVPYHEIHHKAPLLQDAYIKWTVEKFVATKKELDEKLPNIFLEETTWVPYVVSELVVPVGASSGRAIIKMPFPPNKNYNEVETLANFVHPWSKEKLTHQVRQGDANSMVMSIFQVHIIAEEAATEIADYRYRSHLNIHEIMAGKPYAVPVPIPSMTALQFMQNVANLNEFEIMEVTAIYKEALGKFLKMSKMLTEIRTKCYWCFEKINLSCREKITSELHNQQYFKAYKALNAFFVRAGAWDTNAFKDEADSYRLQVGQDLNSHLDAVHQALKKWAASSWLNSVLRIPNFDTDLTTAAIDMSEQIGIWNSGDLTDVEIMAAHAKHPFDPFNGWVPAVTAISPVVITEVRRFQIFKDSVIGSPRFRIVAEMFSSMNENERTVTAITTRLRNQETFFIGREALEQEQISNPGYQARIANYLACLKTHIKPMEVCPSNAAKKRTAMELHKLQTADGGSMLIAEKHCLNHPKSKSHTTEECKASPKRPKVEDSNNRADSLAFIINRSPGPIPFGYHQLPEF